MLMLLRRTVGPAAKRCLVSIWRSPSDQPRWARPALAFIATAAGLSYGWALNQDVPELFYGAAARSMTLSWRDFFFGAFDPMGTVTVDKLPGELWVQALFARILGFHTWVIMLPQTIEGVLTVLVLYRAVRRLAGPKAGIVAAAVLAASPASVLLNRGNISDSLLILCLTLAVDAAAKAIATSQPRSLLIAGLYVGLAFQAKMLEAWILLVPIAATCLISYHPLTGSRAKHLGLFVLVAVGVSLSWMTVVSLVPGHDRPYVDGSHNDSVFEQVFDYNGFARLSGAGAASGLGGQVAPFITGRSKYSLQAIVANEPASWNRLLSGPLGDNDGWFMPGALCAAFALLVRRRDGRISGSLQASLVLWGGWFLLLFLVLSVGQAEHTYYVAALSPPVAALCGIGFANLWEARRHRVGPNVTIAVVALGSAAYAAFLLPVHGGLFGDETGVPSWSEPLLFASAACVALVFIAVIAFKRSRTRLTPVLLVIGLISVLAVPTVASVDAVRRGLGPSDYAFEPTAISQSTGWIQRLSIASGEKNEATTHPRPGTSQIVFATESSQLAELPIFLTGEEVLPIGGFLGAIPEPTLSQLRSDILTGQLQRIEVGEPPSQDPRIVWIRNHCVPTGPSGMLYSCSPAGAER